MNNVELITFIIIVNIVLLIFIIGTVVFIIQYRKRKMEHNKEKAELNIVHEEEILHLQLETQQQTMQQIGREIHDSVGQKLTLASLYAQQLAYENKAPQITDKIENIGHIINDSLQELRQLSKSLTDNVIEENDLITLIELECSKIKALKQCDIRFETKLQAVDLNYKAKNILLRVIQEFIQNSIKHAGCNLISIKLSVEEQFLFIQLSDDGKGFDISEIKSTGIGLTNMSKRIKMLKGDYGLHSKRGMGTELKASIPYPI